MRGRPLFILSDARPERQTRAQSAPAQFHRLPGNGRPGHSDHIFCERALPKARFARCVKRKLSTRPFTGTAGGFRLQKIAHAEIPHGRFGFIKRSSRGSMKRKTQIQFLLFEIGQIETIPRTDEILFSNMDKMSVFIINERVQIKQWLIRLNLQKISDFCTRTYHFQIGVL